MRCGLSIDGAMTTRTRGAAAFALAAAVACNQGLEPAPAPTSCPPGFVGVCGTVSFVGQVPESTAKVFVVAFDTFPKSQNDLFKFKPQPTPRSEEHTSELQSQSNLVCRLLLEKKKK